MVKGDTNCAPSTPTTSLAATMSPPVTLWGAMHNPRLRPAWVVALIGMHPGIDGDDGMAPRSNPPPACPDRKGRKRARRPQVAAPARRLAHRGPRAMTHRSPLGRE